MKKLNGVLWGVVLVAVGVILALNAFGVTSLNIFFDGWWTLIIIVPCVIGLITERDKLGSLIGLCIGVFLMLCCRGVLSFGLLWKLLIPAIIVAVGLKMIFSNFFASKGNETNKKLLESGGELKSGTGVFSGNNMNFDGEVFEGAELNAVFGGVKCDLRGAVIEKDCVINASAVFGGITVFVPDNINVKVNSNSVFGGVSDKEHRNNPGAPYTLYLNGTCLFGGIEIK